ncbi:unnamed protein product [Angiostrongylus costaricensis]|uniref:Otopetrin-3 n=1 Tax=Angiostrongylus costaricensis TaxID=334426 RepID=A0A0R3PUA4_ANGCS|nr:unnamed protein product [Angiostrongylus costaricensis]
MDDHIEMIDKESVLLDPDASTISRKSSPSIQLRKWAGRSRQVYWFFSDESRTYLFKLFTCFYALFIIICGVVIALSNLILSASRSSIKAHIKDLILGFWTFGGSILFISYSGFLVYRQHQEVAAKRKTLAFTKIPSVGPEVVANTNTGSLYLRIGCVVFGLIGVVYYGLIFVICTLGWSKSEDQAECNTMSNFLNFFTALFIFLQMWFVYCNGKIIFTGQGNIARFGLMHLCGTNLWMWLRYILYEEQETITEIRQISYNHILRFAVMAIYEHNNKQPTCKRSKCVFIGFIRYTCVVEYSLICAGVAFVFWTNIDLCKQESALRRSRKRSLLTVDCSRTAEGLFGGFFLIAITIIAIALYNTYSSETELAEWIFTSTNLVFFSLSTSVCFYAFWRMKVLKFNEEKKDDDASSAELLDRILLVVGLVGEMVFTVGGILAFVNHPAMSSLSITILITNVFRLIQVTLQSGLILVGSKLVLDEDDNLMLRFKPGKQMITFLLMINCAQFLMNVFEAQKAGVTEEILRLYGSYYWAILVRGCSPLTIFYRFHSSACFAEIWKKTFRAHKKIEHTTHI